MKNQDNVAIIANDKTLSTEEKVKRIQRLRDSEIQKQNPNAPAAMLPFLTPEAKRLSKENIKAHRERIAKELAEEAGNAILIFDTFVQSGKDKLNIPNINALLLLRRLFDNEYAYIAGMYQDVDRMGIIGYIFENQYDKELAKKTDTQIMKEAAEWYSGFSTTGKQVLFSLIDRAVYAQLDRAERKKKIGQNLIPGTSLSAG